MERRGEASLLAALPTAISPRMVAMDGRWADVLARLPSEYRFLLELRILRILRMCGFLTISFVKTDSTGKLSSCPGFECLFLFLDSPSPLSILLAVCPAVGFLLLPSGTILPDITGKLLNGSIDTIFLQFTFPNNKNIPLESLQLTELLVIPFPVAFNLV